MINTQALYLKNLLPVNDVHVKNGEICLMVNQAPIILKWLRSHTLTQCKQLVDICALDMYKNDKNRFSVNYTMYSPRFSNRITVNVQTNTSLPSVIHIFQGAN